MDLESTDNKIKKTLHWIGKNLSPFIVGIIVGSSVVFSLVKFNIIPISKSGPASVVDVDVNQESSTTDAAKDTSCTGEMFQNKLEVWETNQYTSADKDGFYCPRSRSSFASPDIWYKNQIPKIFESIEIKYQSKNKNNNIDNPSAFIFSLGENPRILRFHITEENFQVVSFEKIIINETDQPLKWDTPGKILTNPIKDETDVLLTIKPVQISGNNVAFSFTLNYISDNTNNAITDTFDYVVNLPDPRPETDNSKTEFGFATLKEDCIKPISYKICY